MPTPPTAFCRPGNQRKKSVLEASEFYYWSIKYQNLRKISIEDFNDNGSITMACDVCIPIYCRSDRRKSVECNKKFNKFDSFKKHVLHCENSWRRPLAWAFRVAVPSIEKLKREREIGDLTIFENQTILKIKFDGLTLINHITELREYINRHGCPCLTSVGLKCERNKVRNISHLFSHLSSVEKKSNRYIVFKATSDEIGSQTNSVDALRLAAEFQKKSVINFKSLKYSLKSVVTSKQQQIEPNLNIHSSTAHSERNQTESLKKEEKRTLTIGGKKIKILYKY